MKVVRTDVFTLALSFSLAGAAFAQLVPAPMTPTTTTAPAAPLLLTPAAPATPAATAPAAEMQPFTGTVTSDRVYVRSGPSSTFYELGQLNKNDLVQVVGVAGGGAWYRIEPPTGVFCLIAKDLVDVDATGAVATVKNDFVNVRAGTALYQNRDSAVLMVVRKGARLDVVGSTDRHIKIKPPAGANVFISSQFVKKSDANYAAATLKLPNGNPVPMTAERATPTTQGSVGVVDITPIDNNTTTTQPTDTNATATNNNTTTTAVSTQPKQYAEGSYDKFNDLNKRTQDELNKPLLQRDVAGLIASYKDLLTTPNLPPSVKIGSESRITALERVANIQAIARDASRADEAKEAARKAAQAEFDAAMKAVQEAERAAPPLAEGVLQTSTVVRNKYALLNPTTQRVVAYVEPSPEIDLSKLLGQYIAVRGTTTKAEGMDVRVIKVTSATMLPLPK